MPAKPFPKKQSDPAAPTQTVPDEAVKAFTVLRKPGGWVMRTYTIVGGTIVDVQNTEPDLKLCAVEALKIAQYKHWTSQ